MSILNNQRVIAIEEHYYDADVVAHFRGIDARTGGFVREQLEDVSEARIQSMDEAGIDVQVLLCPFADCGHLSITLMHTSGIGQDGHDAVNVIYRLCTSGVGLFSA